MARPVMPSALGCVSISGSRSSTTTGTSCSATSHASMSPIGPPPTTATCAIRTSAGGVSLLEESLSAGPGQAWDMRLMCWQMCLFR
ncbi:hypothetical protein GCM10023334_084090 [Nonomuraea thailandensis]